ncbi:MAG: GNAT family N-acetyltransferase [Nautiliaceae bacterium]
MNKLYNFSKENKIFKNIHHQNIHPEGEEHKYKIFLDDTELTKDFVIWYKKSYNHCHLSYIGFKEEFRGKGILKNYIHPHCIEYMRKNGVEKVTLRPLVKAFIVWVSLGFEIIKKSEELSVKQLIKEYLLENDIISTEDFGNMSLQEIVKKYKEVLKNENFPPKLEKVYYTNFQKALK